MADTRDPGPCRGRAPSPSPPGEADAGRGGGERLDSAALVRWMDAQRLPGAGSPLELRSVAGGASNEIFELRRGDARCILRCPPRDVPAGRNEAMLREYRVLHALRESDVPHPRALAVCADPSVIGCCFYLMEPIDGWTPMGRLDPPFDRDLAARREMGFALVDGIARLSNVDWRAAGLDGFGRPEGFLERQVDRWLAHLSAVRFRELPGLDEAAAWLRAHVPRHHRIGIVHGDYQFANVMFRHGTPAHLAAIVDWEMSTVGDPLLDLGWVLMSWPDPDEDRTDTRYFDYSGMPSRAELMQHHAARSGLPLDEIDYYLVLARFKMACVLEAGYARYVQGRADNPRMQHFGAVVLEMAEKAADLARRSRLPARA